MKFCPNPRCAYALRHHRPLEYRDDIAVCADCGFLLSETPVEIASPRAAVAVRPAQSDLATRVLLTVVGAVLMLAGFQLSLFGQTQSVMGEDSSSNQLRQFNVSVQRLPFS